MDPTQHTPLATRLADPDWWKARLAFVPSLSWNLLLARVFRLRNWWDEVDEFIIVGAMPFPEDVDALSSLGVVGVVNTCEEYAGPIRSYDQAGVEQLRLPTIDFTPPTLEAVELAVEFITRFADAGGRVYVHCKAGRARSATVAACWLIARHRMTPGEAQLHLLSKRPHVSRRIADRDVVKQFYRRRSDSDAAKAPASS